MHDVFIRQTFCLEVGKPVLRLPALHGIVHVSNDTIADPMMSNGSNQRSSAPSSPDPPLDVAAMLAIAAQARRVVAGARKISHLAHISVAPGRKQGPGSQEVGLPHILSQLPGQVLEILREAHPFMHKWLKDRDGAHDILGKGLA